MKKMYTRDTSTSKKESKSYNTGIDWSSFIDEDGTNESLNIEDPKPRKRGRPRKSESTTGMTGLTRRYETDVDSDKMLTTKQPYNTMYRDTQSMLSNTVAQIDIVSRDIKDQIDAIKISKTIRGKYKYLSDLASSQSSLLNAKIAAIREMNKTITDANNLELKRQSTLKEDNSVDDDKRIMDLYNAFIKTPISGQQLPQGYASPLGPSMMDISMPSNNLQIFRNDLQSQEDDIGYQNYLNNMTPEQKRMYLERDPNIQTVVVYNQETGDRYFDVIDIRTGKSIPNIAKPDPFLLDNMSINLRSGTARNSDANLEFGLVVIGTPSSINDF